MLLPDEYKEGLIRHCQILPTFQYLVKIGNYGNL